jgi:hypothetical protein
MTAQIRARDTGGTLRTLVRVRARDESGTLRTITRILVRDASNILRTVWQGGISASLSSSSVTASGATSLIVTGSVTVTPSGGTAPYTYLWQAAPYNTDGITVTSPTAATTTFRRNSCASGDTYLGNFFCTVSDAYGVTVDTGMVDVAITRT